MFCRLPTGRAAHRVCERGCLYADCEFSQDRKGGGGVKEVKRAGEGQEGRKEGIGMDLVARMMETPTGRERMNGRSRKDNVQIG